jgi:hypothetical protein
MSNPTPTPVVLHLIKKIWERSKFVVFISKPLKHNPPPYGEEQLSKTHSVM